ncbi:hypothetical protein [Phaffia rhodozyma]|uniref:Uncharacterized protein n=1 Tax=Phaffia rhodozyma TaxID=264483 RepID=A0A0F7SF75_PHARH|nr:hypothetical protein [Phaffia rhodozyma]
MGSKSSKIAKEVPLKKFPTRAPEAIKQSIPYQAAPSSFPSKEPARPKGSSSVDGSSSSAVGESSSGQKLFASASRTDEIERDGGKDLQFLNSLASLGQVVIPDLRDRRGAINPSVSVLQNRTLDPISFPTGSHFTPSPSSPDYHNRLEAPDLLQLLERRLLARTEEEVEDLAKAYNVDVEMMDRLGQWVNAPSVDWTKEEIVNSTDGSKSTRVWAEWKDPIVPVGSTSSSTGIKKDT